MPGVNTSANIMFDDCSSATIITHDYAALAGYKGTEVEYTLKVMDSPPVLKKTTLYELALRDNMGEIYGVSALGIHEITDFSVRTNLDLIKHVFPQAPAAVWRRPVGPIDILIGGDYTNLHPSGGRIEDKCEVGNLRLWQSKFGCGWVISGSHSDIKIREHNLTQFAKTMINSASVNWGVGCYILEENFMNNHIIVISRGVFII